MCVVAGNDKRENQLATLRLQLPPAAVDLQDGRGGNQSIRSELSVQLEMRSDAAGNGGAHVDNESTPIF